MKQKHEILLASGSPRRRELLTQAGFSFTVLTADVDETIEEIAPDNVVAELSKRKAEAVHKKSDRSEMIIVAADTIPIPKMEGIWELIFDNNVVISFSTSEISS